MSNWGVPGLEARHNLKYWGREPTLGLGVSAHELWDGRRRANVSALAVYIESIGKGKRPTALDQPIGAEAAAREKLMLGLRLSDGVPRSELETFVAGSPDTRLRGDSEAGRGGGVPGER